MRFVRTEASYEAEYREVWVPDPGDEGPVTWGHDAELSIVGRPTVRQDGMFRVSGRARYTTDVQHPGMLHAAVLRSSMAHCRVVRLDLDAARSTPGVRAVLGPETALSCSLPEPLLRAEPVYAGQAVAVVAADSHKAALDGVAALAPRVEALPHVVDVEAALGDLRFTSEPSEESRGDVDAALATAEVTVELMLDTGTQAHTALEPHAAVAVWEGDRLTVWLSTQGMFAARLELARAFGLPRDSVRVVAEFVGGGFGAKPAAGFEALAAAELARVTGRPVRLVNDRHAELLDGGRRAATRLSVRLGARRDGTLTAIDADAVVAMGEGGYLGPILAPAMTLYRCDDARALVFPVRMSLRGQDAFRAPGGVEGISAFEQAVDELAAVLELDPLELRRRNHVEVDQLTGLPYSSKRLLECYELAAELAGWDERHRLRDPQPDGLLRGMGCASQIWWGGGGPPAHAAVHLDADGRAHVVTGIQDIGTGTLTSARLVAAEELGLPIEHVRVSGGDTAYGVYGPVAAGSQTTPAVLPAVRSAAAEARDALLGLASEVLEIAVADLLVRDGRIRSRDGALDVPVSEITVNLGDGTLDGAGARGPNPQTHRVHTFGCHVAQVAVDPGTGAVRVERIVAVHDVGRIINPLAASSQVEGGVLQGLAFALSEELVVDPTTGVPVNAHLDDYKVPTIADTPEIVVAFVDIADENLDSIGAKGLGEPPIIPPAAAAANAFAHATGRRCRAFPMTPARVLEALS